MHKAWHELKDFFFFRVGGEEGEGWWGGEHGLTKKCSSSTGLETPPQPDHKCCVNTQTLALLIKKICPAGCLEFVKQITVGTRRELRQASEFHSGGLGRFQFRRSALIPFVRSLTRPLPRLFQQPPPPPPPPTRLPYFSSALVILPAQTHTRRHAPQLAPTDRSEGQTLCGRLCVGGWWWWWR